MEKQLRRTGAIFAFVALPLGLVLFIGGLIMGYYLYEFGLLLNPLTPQGVLWLLIGFVSLLVGTRGRRRLNRLKDDGHRYDADVTDIAGMGAMVRMGGSTSARMECMYQNERGERCLVKSRHHLVRFFDTEATLSAVVYVDKHDPSRYEVELFRKASIKSGYDKDYR